MTDGVPVTISVVVYPEELRSLKLIRKSVASLTDFVEELDGDLGTSFILAVDDVDRLVDRIELELDPYSRRVGPDSVSFPSLPGSPVVGYRLRTVK